MTTAGSRQNIKCSEKVPGLLVAIAGLLTSLWTNCIFVIIFFQYGAYDYQYPEKYITDTILQSFQLTHLIIILTCTVGLILGLKEKNQTYLSPWLIVKIIELIALIIGCSILIIVERYVGVVSVGICFLMIAGYIYMYVWVTYRRMNEVNRTTSLENVSLHNPNELPLPKDPPSYDSFMKDNFRT